MDGLALDQVQALAQKIVEMEKLRFLSNVMTKILTIMMDATHYVKLSQIGNVPLNQVYVKKVLPIVINLELLYQVMVGVLPHLDIKEFLSHLFMDPIPSFSQMDLRMVLLMGRLM